MKKKTRKNNKTSFLSVVVDSFLFSWPSYVYFILCILCILYCNKLGRMQSALGSVHVQKVKNDVWWKSPGFSTGGIFHGHFVNCLDVPSAI